MPNVLQPNQELSVDFVPSVPLDLLNAMYFTFLAGTLEGVGDWPARTKRAARRTAHWHAGGCDHV